MANVDPPAPPTSSSGVHPSAIARHYKPADSDLKPATRQAVIESCNCFMISANRYVKTEVWAHLRPSLSDFLGFSPPELDERAIRTIAAKEMNSVAAKERDEEIARAQQQIEKARKMYDFATGRVGEFVDRGGDFVEDQGHLPVDLKQKLKSVAGKLIVGNAVAKATRALVLSDADVAELDRVSDLVARKIKALTGVIRHCTWAADAAARGYFRHLGNLHFENPAAEPRNADDLSDDLRKFRQSRVLRHFNFRACNPQGQRLERTPEQEIFAEHFKAASAGEDLPRPNESVKTLDQLTHIDESNAEEEKTALAQLRPVLQLKNLVKSARELYDKEKQHFFGQGVGAGGGIVPDSVLEARRFFLDCFTGLGVLMMPKRTRHHDAKADEAAGEDHGSDAEADEAAGEDHGSDAEADEAAGDG